ncbi:hypothetical protein, partial [Secundilactobacillus paracollinoides]|uniref:hypothetical protein n=1 Tax=Secundilactobacillus paracollinoides TaxID=240427 RepID=UPI000B045D11
DKVNTEGLGVPLALVFFGFKNDTLLNGSIDLNSALSTNLARVLYQRLGALNNRYKKPRLF